MNVPTEDSNRPPLSSFQLKVYARAGLDPQEAERWAGAGISHYQAEGYRTAGLDLDTALQWSETGIGGTEAAMCAKAGMGLEEAHSWKLAGIPIWNATRAVAEGRSLGDERDRMIQDAVAQEQSHREERVNMELRERERRLADDAREREKRRRLIDLVEHPTPEERDEEQRIQERVRHWGRHALSSGGAPPREPWADMFFDLLDEELNVVVFEDADGRASVPPSSVENAEILPILSRVLPPSSRVTWMEDGGNEPDEILSTRLGCEPILNFEWADGNTTVYAAVRTTRDGVRGYVFGQVEEDDLRLLASIEPWEDVSLFTRWAVHSVELGQGGWWAPDPPAWLCAKATAPIGLRGLEAVALASYLAVFGDDDVTIERMPEGNASVDRYQDNAICVYLG